MEAASPTATTPRSTHSFEPTVTSTPALGGAESRTFRRSKFGASMDIDHSMEDKNEQECVDSFVCSTCGCKLGPQGSTCSCSLTKETIEKCRADNVELSRDELGMVILAQI